jgi:hypothetical protein
MKNKTMVTMVKDINSLIGWYKSYGHEVREIVTDSEANFVGIQADMEAEGVNMKFHTPETHNKRAE